MSLPDDGGGDRPKHVEGWNKSESAKVSVMFLCGLVLLMIGVQKVMTLPNLLFIVRTLLGHTFFDVFIYIRCSLLLACWLMYLTNSYHKLV